jgi:2-keto-4-pentenoate hydratase/2-oxohepta-3-ene-1,7-dioic acid hydratase in catechol pathway
MRFVRARTDQGLRVGVLDHEGTVTLSSDESALEPYFGDNGDALTALGGRILSAAAGEQPLDDLELVRPVDPPSLRDFMVFEQHATPSWRARGLETGPDIWFHQPVGYFSNAANLLGPRDEIEIPGGSQRLDFELEIGAVVGREARSVTPDEAGAYLAGYLILCDWSARDVQFREMDGQLGPFKGKDFASSLGPVFVTPDELGGYRNGTGFDLKMTASVNERVYGSDLWSSAYWSFEELISYASWNSRVEPGALIGSGTCQGGCILELSLRHGPGNYPYLVADDRVTLTVDTLGEICSTVAASSRGPWPGYRERPDR